MTEQPPTKPDPADSFSVSDTKEACSSTATEGALGDALSLTRATPATPPGETATVSGKPKRRDWWMTVFVILFGVILPAVALGVELALRLCRRELFDPLPTPIHAALVGLVPLLLALLLVPAAARAPRLSRIAIGMVLTVTGVYSLLFAPLSPLAVIFTLFYGLGLLALSPLLAFAAAIVTYFILARRSRATPILAIPPTVVGVAIAAGLFATPILHTKWTERYLHIALSAKGEAAADALQRLRRSHGEELLLQRCTRRGRREGLGSLLTGDFAATLTTEDAEKLYYRVTGTKCPTELDDDAGMFGDRGRRGDIGDPDVPTRTLKLIETRVDGSVDSTAAIAYLEWTWVLSNTSPVAAEARAELVLPEGAVLSRATLWVNDEPREAVFAGRQEVIRAYENIVNRRRDPLLLTWIGPGRIELRCFPVQSTRPMKLRLGMTAPLTRIEAQKAHLAMPRLENPNFVLEGKEALWIDATRPFRRGNFEAQRVNNAYRLQSSSDLGSARALAGPVSFDVPGIGHVSWTPDPIDPSLLVTQRIVTVRPKVPSRVLVVLATSSGQEAAIAGLAAALEALPKDVEIEVRVTEDDGRTLGSARGGDLVSLRSLAKRVSSLIAVGGVDSSPSLLRALENARQRPDTLLLWIHGAQLIELSHSEQLHQALERGRPTIPIYAMSTGGGRNLVRNSISQLAEVFDVDASAGTKGAIEELFHQWSGALQYRAVWERASAGSVVLTEEAKTSEHLSRLWAANHVEVLVAEGKRAEAVALASQRKLVTRVSGAVVLETDKDYKDQGLTPPGPDRIPSVPEPGTWIALAITLFGAVLWLLTCRRNSSKSTCMSST